MTDIDELFGAFDEAPATQTPDERGAARKRSRSEDDGAERAPPRRARRGSASPLSLIHI